MKIIKLTKNKITLVDDDIYSVLGNLKWCIRSGYAARSFPREASGRLSMYLHHCVIGFPLNGFEVDHIDGDTLNNQRSNLRIVTIRDNQSNQHRHRKGKLVGTSWNKRLRRWQACIQIDGELKFLGYFDTEQKAHEIYLGALIQYQSTGIINNRVRIKSSKSYSQYVGVSWNKQHKKWMSYINVEGKRKHLGYFPTEQEAHEAYMKAANAKS